MFYFLMRKGVVSFSGMIVGLVLLVIAFMGPWYAMNLSGALGMDSDVEFYLTRMEVKGILNNQDLSVSVGYADAKENAQSMGVDIESFTIIENVMYLTLFAMMVNLIAIIGIAAFVFRLGTPKIMKYVGGGFALLTFVLALVPALYIMNTKFAENTSGFWFSQSVVGITITGGPGYAWYLMIVVTIIVLICGVSILVKKIVPERTSSEKVIPPVDK
jgi:hypothetical protein